VTGDGPASAELEKAALESVWPTRVVEFTRWVGAGRKLTQTGRLTLADARMLVQTLGTGDVVDALIGDRMFRTKSSEELTELSAVLEWARAVGLVRRRGNQLMAVKKHAGLLERPLALWERMFEVVGELGPVVCPSGWAMSMLHDNFEAGLGLLLAAMDVDSARIDVQEVAEQVWASLTPLYRMDGLTELQSAFAGCSTPRIASPRPCSRPAGSVNVRSGGSPGRAVSLRTPAGCWRVQEATGQWSALAAAWWRSTRALPHGLSVSAVLQSVTDRDVGEVRRTVVEALSQLPAGGGAADLAATVEWRLPSVAGAGQQVASVLVEAEALGLAVAGR
jgi:hypothetical protein